MAPPPPLPAEMAVLQYLTHQNRPYSVNDIVLNLHKEHGKTAIQRALDVLVADGKVKEKVNGKQKAYVVDQSGLPTATDQELADLEKKVAIVRAKADEEGKAARAAEAELRALTAEMKTNQIECEIASLESEVSDLTKRRDRLAGTNAEPMDRNEIDKIGKEREQKVKEWRRRKRMCLNVIDSILENYPKSKRILMDDIGMETDEDVGVQMPQGQK